MRQFSPKEIIFCRQTDCNLSCAHCAVTPSKSKLSLNACRNFLRSCEKTKINRISFTGGEPFLDLDFILAACSYARKRNFIFGRITTNACWFKSKQELTTKLKRLKKSGYDGDLAISFDQFHDQPLQKIIDFITISQEIFQRSDLIWLISVFGKNNDKTKKKINSLAKALKLKHSFSRLHNQDMIIRINQIRLTPVNKAASLADPWQDQQWFNQDYCQGPGNVLYVMPDGAVKPCCGYANELEQLTIGNIYRQTARQILKSSNKLVKTIFTKGLLFLKNKAQKQGILFPGKTKDPCFFCYYLLARSSKDQIRKILEK